MAPHRHQASLEGILNVSGPEFLPVQKRTQAKQRFYSIINYCRTEKSPDAAYSRPLLVQYTYEYSCSELSQDTFLRAFFESIDLDVAGGDIDFDDNGDEINEKLTSFADFLLDNFFIPPHHATITRSSFSSSTGPAHESVGTPERLSVLRGACLIRDRHRCVISRAFDRKEAIIRLIQQGSNAQDDEGHQLQGQPLKFLEVAHILPHSLTQTDSDNTLSESKKAAVMILNMFDCDVSLLIDGTNIDRAFNAMTLARDLHTIFGNFQIYFEPVPNQEHTYQIDTFLPAAALPEFRFPITRTLHLTDDRSIDPPLARLLALHRAIAYILHLSGAGEYIDKILRDMEELGAREGGSTELGRLITLRLGGWLDKAGTIQVLFNVVLMIVMIYANNAVLYPGIESFAFNKLRGPGYDIMTVHDKLHIPFNKQIVNRR
ncbi:uncharacterized protein CIMG_09047 [Coccidioides immitis RS]|uniref:HNH nuclease domain-containing protein n=1 Tax=Coccidioides immitis (strain RS) TaxID=246410 RepID=J3K1I5_COCIM|nr:uncharacterized protein CIMG_09047 [Coccidioides immitis RS]EAS27843.3 hypothetical protein CIMG_09047 [Coccidioides immitis RS]